MRILHSILAIDHRGGGPVRAVIDLSQAMVDRGHTVATISTTNPDAPESWNRQGANPRSIIHGPRSFRNMRFRGASLTKIRDAIGACDVVHIHGIWTPYQTQVAREAHRQNKPYVISCRGMLDDWCMDQRRPKKLVYLKAAGGSWMLNHASLVHCTAQGELDQSSKWFPGSTGRVISNLLDLAPFETMPGPAQALEAFPALDTDQPTLLFLSRIHYKKGIEHLIQAAALLRDRGNPHRVLIAGSGDDDYQRGLERLVAELDLADSVSFLGMVLGDLKLSLYQACDLFVLPTSQENFGFVLYESLASGTPLLTTKGVDTWPELQEAGGIITDQDATEIADAIAAHTADREGLAQRGQQGRSWVFDHLNPRTIADQFEAFYRDAIDAG